MIVFKKHIRFFSIFLFVFICTALGIEAFFYEDEVYFLLMKSMIQDFDYNLINQVSEEEKWLVTRNYFFPSHHSEVQTPLVFIAYCVESLVRLILPVSMIKDGVMSGHLMSFTSLGIGYIYSVKFLNSLNIKTQKCYFLMFLFGSSLFYFSFMTVTVIEIMSFSLTSFSLYLAFNLLKRSKRYFWLLGVSSSILLLSKFYYLSLYILILYRIYKDRNEYSAEDVFFFMLGNIMIFIPGLLNHYVKYGEYFFWAGVISDYILLFSWENFFITISDGYFGVGGLFYINPVLLPSVVGLLMWSVLQIRERRKIVEIIIIMSWLVQGLFTPLFLAGSLVEDHYVGRTFYTILPIYLLGFCYFLNIVKSKIIKAVCCLAVIVWQAYHMLSYIRISREGHYSYTIKKLLEFDVLLEFIKDLMIIVITNVSHDFAFYFLFLFIISIVLYNILYKYKEIYMSGFLVLSLALLFIASILNFLFSKENSLAYFSNDKIRLGNISIGGTPSSYSFIYVLDILHTQEMATNNKNIKNEINRMRHRYYDKITNSFIKKSKAFDDELINRTFTDPRFNYYLKDSGSL